MLSFLPLFYFCSYNAKKFFFGLTVSLETDIYISVRRISCHFYAVVYQSTYNQKNTMITAIIASVTPFVAAQPVDTVVAMPETPVATYNWSDQNAKTIISDEDAKNGAMGTFSSGGVGQPRVVDDWNLA